MESITIKPATYDDLKPYANNKLENIVDIANPFSTKILIILLIIGLLIIGLYIILEKDLIIITGDPKTITLIVLLIYLGVIVILYQKERPDAVINYELEHNKPQIQSIAIKNANVVNVDRSDSNENQQEITLQDDNKNYYITIPDTTAVNENDKIDIKIKDQLIDKTLKKNDLSQSINQPKSKITIKHNQSTNNVPLITYLPDTFNQNGGNN